MLRVFVLRIIEPDMHSKGFVVSFVIFYRYMSDFVLQIQIYVEKAKECGSSVLNNKRNDFVHEIINAKIA